jgi:hypothetical protein
MNRGSIPTDLNALTGEFTPPGKTFFAFEKSSELSIISGISR